jgi:hypothetical protein
VNEIADHLGHADPGFTARTYAHVMRDASKRRRVPIARAIAAARRPLVDPSTPGRKIAAGDSRKKPLQIVEADARTRTADPFITRDAAVRVPCSDFAQRSRFLVSVVTAGDRACRGRATLVRPRVQRSCGDHV